MLYYEILRWYKISLFPYFRSTFLLFDNICEDALFTVDSLVIQKYYKNRIKLLYPTIENVT